METKRCNADRVSCREASSLYDIDIMAEPGRDDSLYVCHLCQGLFRHGLDGIVAATDRDLSLYSDYLAWSARETDKQKASDAEYMAWVAAGRP